MNKAELKYMRSIESAATIFVAFLVVCAIAVLNTVGWIQSPLRALFGTFLLWTIMSFVEVGIRVYQLQRQHEQDEHEQG